MDSKVISQDMKPTFSSQRKKEKEKLSFGINSTYISMLGVIILLLGYYVFTINGSATTGYNIRDLQEQKRELSIEKERLDTKIAELESSSSVESQEALENTEEASNPEYLVIRDNVQYVYNY